VNGCVFCAIVEGRSPSWKIYEDENAVAFMDINPATDGHVLVVPRSHIRDLWEIGEQDAANVMTAAVRVGERLKKVLKPDGLNILHATGAAAFQTVFHFHLHLIPRYAGDAIRLPWIRQPGDRDKIAAMAERIASSD
jgi:histidine triad (HIT) family protein